MTLSGFRHKGLKLLYTDDSARAVPPEMADRLRKLLFALETASGLDDLRRFPGWRLAPVERLVNRVLEPKRDRQLEADLPLR
jgi:proteic killer suppression protein